MNAIIESRNDLVRTVTIVGKKGVYYSVEQFSGTEWVTTWDETVKFEGARTHRPGGTAFKLVARKQERIADDLFLNIIAKANEA